MRERERLDEELDVLSRELRRLPTPRPPEGLVSRVRRLAHLELAGRADEKLSDLVLGCLVLFSWTVSLFTLFAVRLVSGETLLAGWTGSTLSWSVSYFAFAWVSGAAVLVLLGYHLRRERRLV